MPNYEDECDELLANQRRNFGAEIDSIHAELRRVREVAANEINLLKKAARLIHKRGWMISGSLEMAECDSICKEAGLNVWEWKDIPGQKACLWSKASTDDEMWETECGKAWCLNEDDQSSLKGNDINFCPFCGKEIEEQEEME